jgi:hypothetical protein
VLVLGLAGAQVLRAVRVARPVGLRGAAAPLRLVAVVRWAAARFAAGRRFPAAAF